MTVDRDSYTGGDNKYYFVTIMGDNRDKELRAINDGYFPCEDWVYWNE